eukprot:1579165-Pyramimonas_sp.AAC.1
MHSGAKAAPICFRRSDAALKQGFATKQRDGFPRKRLYMNEDGDKFSQPFPTLLLLFGSGNCFLGEF